MQARFDQLTEHRSFILQQSREKSAYIVSDVTILDIDFCPVDQECYEIRIHGNRKCESEKVGARDGGLVCDLTKVTICID